MQRCALALAAVALQIVPAPADAPLFARPAGPVERSLSAIASTIAYRPVEIRCGNTHSAEALGIMPWHNGTPRGYAVIQSTVCDDLVAFVADPRASDPCGCANPDCHALDIRSASALATVAHESFHLRGIRSEARAECDGMQTIAFVGERLGATASQARAVARFYWFRLHGSHRRWEPAYWSQECRNGGELDLRKSDPNWPS